MPLSRFIQNSPPSRQEGMSACFITPQYVVLHRSAEWLLTGVNIERLAHSMQIK